MIDVGKCVKPLGLLTGDVRTSAVNSLLAVVGAMAHCQFSNTGGQPGTGPGRRISYQLGGYQE